MADRDLPIWTFSPNWSDTILERLEWLTDVMASNSRAEQRAAVRLTPRRVFEFKVNPVGRTRSYLELWLHKLGAAECLLPLWHDRGRLSAPIASGVTRVPVDTTYREFEEGGLALLLTDAFTWELLEIESLDDTGLDVASETLNAWGKGVSVYPLRVMTLDAEVTSSALTTRVGEAKFTFTSNRANPLTVSAEPLPVYDGLPVITLPPNRMSALEAQYSRAMEELDTGIGRRRRYDENGRAFSKQFYNWRAKGRQQHAALRETLYRLSGRRKAVWMPTFNEDVTLTANVGPTSGSFYIEKIGYKYTGSVQPIEGKRDIMIRDDGGTPRYARVNSIGPDPAIGQERLILSANAGFTATAGRTGSFMSTVRLDQDVIEITHHTDSDGLCECSAAFVAFSNTRSVTGPLILPTPSLDESLTACGTPEPDRDGTCLTVAVFEGWVYRFKAAHGPPGTEITNGLGSWVISLPVLGAPNGIPPGLADNEIGWQWNTSDPNAIAASGVAVTIMEQHGVDWVGANPIEHEVRFYGQHWTSNTWTLLELDPTYGSYSEFISHPGAFGYSPLLFPPYMHIYAGIFPCYWRVYT